MGTKYQSQSSSGYDASPPPDDGSTTSSNQITWSGIKSKLSDPISTLATAINSQLVTALDTSVTTASVNYTTVAGDHQKPILCTGTITISLGDATTMAVGYQAVIVNHGSGTITVAVATSTDTLNGTTNGTLTLTPGDSATFEVNSTHNGYRAISGFYAKLQGTSLTNGQLLIGSTSAIPVAAALTGTTNQVVITNAAGSITLSLPQSIGTSSNVQFGGINATPIGATTPSTGAFTTLRATGALTVGTASANSTVIDIENPGYRSWYWITSNGALLLNTNVPNTLVTFSDSGAVQLPSIGTTASAANAFLDSAASNNLLRSTSQGKYKLDQQPLTLAEAKAVSFGRKSIHYVSASEADDPKRRWIGYLAEDVGPADHRFATFDKDGTPNWVQYERFVVPHGLILEDHEARLKKLEAAIH